MADLNVSILMKLVDQVTGPVRRLRTAVLVAMKGVEAAKLKADKSFERAANLKQAAEGVAAFAQKARDAIAKPVEVAEDFQAQMSRVKAISGATGEDFNKLRATALQLGADTAFSSSQAAQGMYYLAQNGFQVTEIVKAMPGVLDLAASSGTDLAVSADYMSNIMGAFKVKAEDATHVADVLAMTSNKSSVGLDDLAETMKYAGPVAQTLGVSLEQTAAMAGLLGNIGIKGSQAGTAMRAAMLNMVNPKGMQKKALSFLHVETIDKQTKQLRPFAEILGEIQEKSLKFGSGGRAKLVDAIFGSEAAPAMLELMTKTGPDGIKKFADSLVNSGGAAAEVAKTMLDNSKGAAEQLGGSWEGLMIVLGDTLLPALTELRMALTSIINVVADWAKAHPNLTKVIMYSMVAVAAFATLLSGALFVASTMFAAHGMLTLIGGWKGVAMAIYRFGIPAIMAVGRAMMSLFLNPVGLVIAAIALLVAAIIWLVRHWDKVVGVWERFKRASLGVKIAIGIILAPISMVVGLVLGLAYAAKTLIDNWEPIKTFFVDLWDGVANAVKTGVDKALEYLDPLLNNPIIDMLVVQPAKAAAALAKSIGGGVADIARGVVDVFAGPDVTQPGPTLGPDTKTVATANGKQQVTGVVKVQIDSEGRPKVKELKSKGGIDLDVDAGMAMVTP